MRTAFFIQTGVTPADIPGLRRLCIKLSLQTRTSLEFFLNLSVSEVIEIADEVIKVAE